jgi:hypothetical protein
MTHIPDRSRGVKCGDRIRLNRMDAPIETVLSYNEPMVSTYDGNSYHIAKIVMVDADERDGGRET